MPASPLPQPMPADKRVRLFGNGCYSVMLSDAGAGYSLWRDQTLTRWRDSPDKLARYRVEPYVTRADVYSVAPHVGRGGWTWYTGLGGWLYRAALEAILGFRLQGKHC